MGLFSNPFKGRRPGTVSTQAPIGLNGYNWEAAIAALEKSPGMSDRAFADAMGPHSWSQEICNDAKKVHRYRSAVEQEIYNRTRARQEEEEQRQGHEERVADDTVMPGEEAQRRAKHGLWGRLSGYRAARKERRAAKQNQPSQALSPQGQQAPSAHQPATDAPTTVEAGKLNLVNYSPEQLMLHVHQELDHAHLGMPWPIWFKWQVGEIWSIIGPIALFAGTAGEVFFFIWNNTENKGAWWVALSVLMTVCVLEFTFMVVSYQSDTIRNYIKAKPGGATIEDKKDLLNHKTFWFLLAVGVAIGQVSFLYFAMQSKLSQNISFLVAFSVGRSAFTLAGDFYSAFVHKEKPSSGEQLKAKNKQRADLASDLLQQKTHEITIINDGTIALHQAHTDAQIKMESMQTELEMRRKENNSRLEARQTIDDQARMFTNLSSGIIRALFDPKMEDKDRAKLLGTMQALMGAGNLLPEGHVDRIEEEKPEDDGRERGL